MQSLSQMFLNEVEAFLETHSLNATQFGREALNDPLFVFDLRKGRSPSMRTVDRVRAFMAKRAGSKAA